MLRTSLAGWHRDPLQIISHHDRSAERHRRLLGKQVLVASLVSLREMREHEQPRPVLARQRGLVLGEGGFTHQHVRILGKRERGIAQAGVHDESEALAPPWLAYLLNGH